MADSDGKREPTDPAKLAQLLDLELMQKRAEWQNAKARHRNVRALAFLFLFIVIAGAIVAFFLFFSSGAVNEKRSPANPGNSPALTQP